MDSDCRLNSKKSMDSEQTDGTWGVAGVNLIHLLICEKITSLSAAIIHGHPNQTGRNLVFLRTVTLFILAVVLWFFFGFITGLHLVCLFFIEKFRIKENVAQNESPKYKTMSPSTVQQEESRESQVPSYSILIFAVATRSHLPGDCLGRVCIIVLCRLVVQRRRMWSLFAHAASFWAATLGSRLA